MQKEYKENHQNMSEDDSQLRRNKQAPGFTTSIVRSRSQLLIERYIQTINCDLEDYTRNLRILKLDIPPEILRSWYPTPNWKKDIDKMIRDFMKVKGKPDANGNFDYMSLFSRAQLLDDGLHLNIDPEVLQIYIINSGAPSLDYNLTKYIKCSYTYEMYWEMLKHDDPRDSYKFFLSPGDINKKFGIKYNVTQIVEKILVPTQREIKLFFDDNLTPRFFTYNERRELIGKCRKIIGWEFTIHNEIRVKRQNIEAEDSFGKIDNILRKTFSDKLRMNTLEQIRVMPSEKIIQIKIRLEKFENSDKSHINTQIGYLCYILQCYDINPRSNKIDKSKIKDAPLFEKSEKDTAAGVGYWFECLTHIKDSSATEKIKELFEKLYFDEYTETDIESVLIFRTSKDVVDKIETFYINDFKRVLLKYFPANLKVYYNAR